MKNLLFVILFFFAAGCSAADLSVSQGEDTQAQIDDRSWLTWETCSQKPQDYPCNFQLVDQDGKEVELYDFYGKVIVVDLSTMWCGVCKSIASKGEELTADYGENNFVWLTILVEDETGLSPEVDDLQRWVESYGAAPPVLAGSRSLIDPNAETGYPVTGWPTLVVIDRNMVLTNGVNGWSESYIRTWVESNL